MALLGLPQHLDVQRYNVSSISRESSRQLLLRHSRSAPDLRVNAAASAATFPGNMTVSQSHLSGLSQLSSSSVSTPLHPEVAGPVTTVHSSQQYQDIVDANPGKLVILMCKAQGCRPCKMFSRKYQRMAEQYNSCIFLDIIGDESTDTRRMMIKNNVKVTPTFICTRDGKVVSTLTGINENHLRTALNDSQQPGETDSAPLD